MSIVPAGVPIVDPEVYLSGFKSIIDITFDGNGDLYVLQFATGATLNPANSGALKRVELAGCTLLRPMTAFARTWSQD